MENLQRNLISFFISFISSRTSDLPLTEQLVKKMLSSKEVQKIIIKAMCKLEPILNQEIFVLQSPKSRKPASNVIKTSKLLLLSQDIKNLMNNYQNIKGQVSSMLDIVDSIHFHNDFIPFEESNKVEPTRELVTFLGTIAKKKRITNDEIDEISEETWSKHLEVEKMLKLEMAKYYDHIDAIETKYFSRINAMKMKTGLKIQNLEEDLQRTWLSLREQIDRSQMLHEDFLSQQHEMFLIEEYTLNQSNDPQAKDYTSALQKLKNLYAAKKIMEKRKFQDEKIVAGLNNKINVLSEKFEELKNINVNMIENVASLSSCLEICLNKANIHTEVKEKCLKYIHKQKCQKLENIIKTEGIFETYSIQTVSNRFDELKEGIVTVSHSIRDENVKIKINKLIIDSKLEQIDRSETLKVIKEKPSFKKSKTVSKSGSRRASSKELLKERPKEESALEKMRKAMMSIDEQIKKSDKVIEENIAEAINISNQSLSEFSVNDDTKPSTRNKRNPSKNNTRTPKLSEGRPEFHSQGFEEVKDLVKREHKACQHSLIFTDAQTQASLDIYSELFAIISKSRARREKTHIQNPEFLQTSEIDSLLVHAAKVVCAETQELACQTDKEPGVLDFATPNNTIIRGLMSKVTSLKSESSVKKKIKVDGNVAENLIIKKLQVPTVSEPKIFATEIKEQETEVVEKSNEKSIEKNNKVRTEESPEKKLKASSNTIPNVYLESKFSKIEQSMNEKKNLKKKILENNSLQIIKESEPNTNTFNDAKNNYKKEFELHTQIRGLKKVEFEETCNMWDEVIMRRILEGEKDKISIYLRGYLGTDKFEAEKSQIILLMASNKFEDFEGIVLNETVKEKHTTNLAAVNNWKTLMEKVILKQVSHFKDLIEGDDSPRNILFKAAKALKYVKHRFEAIRKPEKRKKSLSKNETDAIIYSSDKWYVNSYTNTPVVGEKNRKRINFRKAMNSTERNLKSKTPLKEKILRDDITKLPYI